MLQVRPLCNSKNSERKKKSSAMRHGLVLVINKAGAQVPRRRVVATSKRCCVFTGSIQKIDNVYFSTVTMRAPASDLFHLLH